MRTFILIIAIPLFATSILTSQEVSTLKKQGACVALPLDSIVKVMNWDMQRVEKSSSGFWGSSMCYLEHSIENMMVRLSWPSKRAIRDKQLEVEYEAVLTKGEKGLFYRELENDGDIQVIYGHGHDNYGKHIVLVRKRYGNSAEAMIELKTPAQDHKKLRKRLTRLMALID
jgi:hypothetical protein